MRVAPCALHTCFRATPALDEGAIKPRVEDERREQKPCAKHEGEEHPWCHRQDTAPFFDTDASSMPVAMASSMRLKRVSSKRAPDESQSR